MFFKNNVQLWYIKIIYYFSYCFYEYCSVCFFLQLAVYVSNEQSAENNVEHCNMKLKKMSTRKILINFLRVFSPNILFVFDPCTSFVHQNITDVFV